MSWCDSTSLRVVYTLQAYGELWSHIQEMGFYLVCVVRYIEIVCVRAREPSQVQCMYI